MNYNYNCQTTEMLKKGHRLSSVMSFVKKRTLNLRLMFPIERGNINIFNHIMSIINLKELKFEPFIGIKIV